MSEKRSPEQVPTEWKVQSFVHDKGPLGLSGLTSASLRKALAKLDEDRAEEWRDGGPRDADEHAFLLMDLASLHAVDPRWAGAHAGSLYSDDHRWDRDRARRTLPTMLGLATCPAPLHGGDESLSDYVTRCNAAAEAAGSERRLHEVVIDADAHVFVATTPEDFDSLVEGGYLPG